MPTSRPYHLSWLCQRVLDLHPVSILDVGIGFGSKGMLFREYTDIWGLRYNKNQWRVRIDGVEIFQEYISNLQREIYDHIFIGDISTMNTDNYDLIYMGDVIEHFEKDEGIRLIIKLISHCNNLIIVTPKTVLEQEEFMGNIHEIHKSQWNADDFIGAKTRIMFEEAGMHYGSLVIEYENPRSMKEATCIQPTSC